MISKGDAITQWAVNQSLEYLAQALSGELTAEDVQAILLQAKYAWKGKRDEAADIGTQAHNWIERHLLSGRVFEEWPDHPNVRNSCEAACRWLDAHHWQTIEVEKQIFHPSYGYAGILDWWATIDGVPAIPDWKTSKYHYDSYRYQTAAYLRAVENETGERIPHRWIVRIDKLTGEVDPKLLPRKDIPADFAAFKAALTLFKRDKKLKEDAKNVPRQ
ncbi:unnamed protein product [Sphagnum jensenii]